MLNITLFSSKRSTLFLLIFIILLLVNTPSHAIIESAVNLPANNKVLFIMGQDSSTLEDYKNEVLDQNDKIPVPGGVTLYTSILPVALDPDNKAPQDAAMYVSGIEGAPVDKSNGDVDFHTTLATYDAANDGKKVALSVGLYLSDEWANCSNQPLRAIIGGSRAVQLSGDLNAGQDVGEINQVGSISYSWNNAIRRMIIWFKHQQRPVFLRIGYEFDGPWNCYNQDFYKAAFIRIKDIINKQNAKNVATVWQAATYPDNGDAQFNFDPFPSSTNVNQTPLAHYNTWYPIREDGTDNVVDWIGLSYFAGPNYLDYQWMCRDSTKPWTIPDGSPRHLQNTLLQIAGDRGKPIFIAEAAPQGFDLVNKNWSCITSRKDDLPDYQFDNGQAIWNAWYVDFFSWIESNRDIVRAVSYINTDWQSQTRWHCTSKAESCPTGYWGVTSIQDDATVLQNFTSELRKSFYINGSTPSSSPVPINSCPPSHPFICDGFCYVDPSQARSAGCTASPSPTSTPTASPTPTPIPSPTPSPSTMPTPSSTPIPTPSPDPSDTPTPVFVDTTWMTSAVPACSNLYTEGSVPTWGYHIYTEENILQFVGGELFARNTWGSNIRAVFFRNNANGRLQHLGTLENKRSGNTATVTIPDDWMKGNTVYYVSYERAVTPLKTTLGDALAYHDSSLFGFNKGCITDIYTGTAETFAGWMRLQHPQGFFNDHNVFNERNDPINNSAGHFKNVPRFTITLIQDQPQKDLLFQVDLHYESYSTLSTTIDITWSGIEGVEARAGGSPRHSLSEQCAPTDTSGNTAICNLGSNFSYGQNIDWELRVIPDQSAGFNLYSQMLYYIKGQGWGKESSDPRALLGGEASVDTFGANQYERAAQFMQHSNTSSLKIVRDFVEQHEDFRLPIGTDITPGFQTCESCHINDGRSQRIFNIPGKGLRIAPPLIGLGLLERVQFNGKTGFGWEGDNNSIEDSVRFALKTDFGLTFPSPKLVERLTHYSQFVAVPQRDKSKLFERDVIAGEILFNGQMLCSSCHQESQIMNNGDIIRPYSDLLRHNMGDGVFRTSPLWGLGRTAEVVAFSMDMMVDGKRNAQHAVAQRQSLPVDESKTLFMHDGRAKGLDEAVRAHGGDAALARDVYISASQTQRNQLLLFLRSL